MKRGFHATYLFVVSRYRRCASKSRALTRAGSFASTAHSMPLPSPPPTRRKVLAQPARRTCTVTRDCRPHTGVGDYTHIEAGLAAHFEDQSRLRHEQVATRAAEGANTRIRNESGSKPDAKVAPTLQQEGVPASSGTDPHKSMSCAEFWKPQPGETPKEWRARVIDIVQAHHARERANECKGPECEAPLPCYATPPPAPTMPTPKLGMIQKTRR